MCIDYIAEIYNSFEPFDPPPEGAYVDCQDVRGGWEVVRELGRKITRSKRATCQLYSGHRGVGKSTELLRLKSYLEKNKFFVVYFAANDEDIEPQDAAYADIVFACTRQLLSAIHINQEQNPLIKWIASRWESLVDLALMEVKLEELTLETGIEILGSISSSIRATPDKRRELRRKIDDNTPSLVGAINEFIAEAQKTLGRDYKGIVLIADNLDRIVETQEAKDQPTNYDEIYLNRSEILRGLDCHVIYTIPISMVYSDKSTQLENNYDKTHVLPMIMVRNGDKNRTSNHNGLSKLRELICRRLQFIEPALVQTMEGEVPGVDLPAVFDSPKTVDLLCISSGGHVRNLMQLIQKAIDWTDELPITAKAAKRAIAEGQETYMRTVQEGQWEILAQVSYSMEISNNREHMRLLFNRCLLEYRYYDEQDRLQIWHDVHPLIEGISKFQKALEKLREQS